MTFTRIPFYGVTYLKRHIKSLEDVGVLSNKDKQRGEFIWILVWEMIGVTFFIQRQGIEFPLSFFKDNLFKETRADTKISPKLRIFENHSFIHNETIQYLTVINTPVTQKMLPIALIPCLSSFLDIITSNY